MTWQFAIVGICIALAALYVVQSAWRTIRGGRCGCQCRPPADAESGDRRSLPTVLVENQDNHG